MAVRAEGWSFVYSSGEKRGKPCMPAPGRSLQAFFIGHPDPKVPENQLRTSSPIVTLQDGLFNNASGRQFELGPINPQYAAALRSAGREPTVAEAMRLFQLAAQKAADKISETDNAPGTADTTTLKTFGTPPKKSKPAPPPPEAPFELTAFDDEAPSPPAGKADKGASAAVADGKPLSRPGAKSTPSSNNGWTSSKLLPWNWFKSKGKPAKPKPPPKAKVATAPLQGATKSTTKSAAQTPTKVGFGRLDKQKKPS